MDLSIMLKNTVITGIELHLFCLALIVLLFNNMRRSFKRNIRKIDFSLYLVYVSVGLMVLSDCVWSAVSNLGSPGYLASYAINLIYFVSSSSAAVCWFVFCMKSLDTKIYRSKPLLLLTLIPYIFMLVLYFTSSMLGLVFSIQDGEYVRGSMFFLDPVTKMGYLAVASVVALISGSKKNIAYLKKKDCSFALFCVPVIVFGIIQSLSEVDFNCLGVTLGLILIYITGITNQDNENTAAIYSLANSFEASYIVNMHTGLIRPLREDRMHDYNTPGMKSMDYTTHFTGVLSKILLSEDKKATLDVYDIKNVAKRFKIDNSFSVRYRVREDSGNTEIHTASFFLAEGSKGKQEFLLGINSIKSESLLYERNERLSHENERLEKINNNIIESVAKIVEARDGGSGEHIVRVKNFTEIIARQIMAEYPEYNLDEEKVKLISSASVLHDVGKIFIPDSILLKPGKLTEEEFETMKKHSENGCDALDFFPMGLDDALFKYALNICRWHHEKYDGKGYPDGLVGEKIPIEAQIVAAADCFDALASDRPYKKAFPPEKALEMIKNGECGEFSPKILDSLEKQRYSLIKMAKSDSLS